MLKAAIIGRPNVGKSTLFNRLVQKKFAIIADVAGVTRDYRQAPMVDDRLDCALIDTAGYEDPTAGTLAARMWQQSTRAMEIADVLLLVVDGQGGLLPLDLEVARLLRKSGKPVLLIVNKCDSGRVPKNFAEFYQLDCGEPLPVSATHGDSMGDIVAWLLGFAEARRSQPLPAPDADDEKALALAIVGRPNAGKSTLFNALLGEAKQLTGPEPGLTRDAIAIEWSWQQQPIRLIDTAGMRRKARIRDPLEKLSVGETLRAIRLAHVVVLVTDATAPLEEQDLEIARHVAEEGRALVVVLNKWDQIKQPAAWLEKQREVLEDSLAQLPQVPIVTTNALHGKGLDGLMRAVLQVYGAWNVRLPTHRLNRWLQTAQAQHTPPLIGGRRLKFRYLTQIKARPPTLILWCNKPSAVPDSYLRYLLNSFRQEFDLPAVPVRLTLKKSDNPYEETGSAKPSRLQKMKSDKQRRQQNNTKPRGKQSPKAKPPSRSKSRPTNGRATSGRSAGGRPTGGRPSTGGRGSRSR